MSLPPHQQRVVDEGSELSAKLSKLTAFMDSPTFKTLDAAEQWRLVRQCNVMADYVAVLAERISAWQPKALA